MSAAELVDNIKKLLNDPDGLTRESLNALASEYAARCRRANETLSRAVVCLQSGQLFEAARIERDAKLIEEIQTLSFEGEDIWREICRGAECEMSAAVSERNSAELQFFIARYETVREVARKYRRLALQVAPIKERLAALYVLCDAFPNAKTLARAADALEKERDKEIRQFCKKLKTEDAPIEKIEKALAELESPLRRSPAPSDALELLRRRARKVKSAAGLEKLRTALGLWAEASLSGDERALISGKAAFDAANVGDLASSLSKDEQAAYEQLRRDTKALQRKQEAQRELKRKTTELARAARTSNNLDKLANLTAEVEMLAESADQTPDLRVATAASNRIESIQTLKRRQLTFVASISLAIMILFATVTFVVFSRARAERDLNEVVAKIEEKLDAFKESYKSAYDSTTLEEAKELVERYDKERPEFKKREKYVEARGKVKSAVKQDEGRAVEFEIRSEEIKKKLDQGVALTDPKTVLEDLAKTPKEKKALSELSAKYLSLTDRAKNQPKEYVKERLDEATKRYEEALKMDQNDRARELRSIVESIRGVRQMVGSADVGEYLEALDELESNLEDARKAVEASKNGSRADRELLAAIGNRSKYGEALDKVAAKLEDEESAKAADAAQEALETASLLEKWNEFSAKRGRPMGSDPDETPKVAAWAQNSATFAEVAKAGQSASGAMGFVPELASFNERVEAWRAFAEGGGFEGMEKNLDDALAPFSEPFYSLKTDGGTVYLNKKPESQSDKEVKYFADRATKLEYNVKRGDSELATESLATSIYRAYEEDNLEGDPKAIFARYMATLRAIARADDAKVDACLKILLLSRTLDACATCPGLSDVAAKFRAAVEEKSFSFEYDFFSESETKEIRPVAQTLLKGLGDLSAELNAAEAKYRELSAPLAGEYSWSGIVQIENGRAIVKLGSARTLASRAPKGSEIQLWIAIPSESAFVRCGSVVNSEPVLNADRDWARFKWLPVFVRTETVPKPKASEKNK